MKLGEQTLRPIDDCACGASWGYTVIGNTGD